MSEAFICDVCGRVSDQMKLNDRCNFLQTDGGACIGAFSRRVMSQEEVENWIMLKGQSQERWFEIRALDPEIDADPTMRALLEALSDMINAGIHNMPFLEAGKVPKPDLSVVKPGGRSAKGD